MELLKIAPWFIAAGSAWTLGFIYNVHGGGELSWVKKMYEQKIAIAAQNKTTPRLLIIGGSGAHYTIDSQIISQGLGIPVINLGLDGPVGLNVILPSVIEQVKKGDIVLLIPEYLLLVSPDGLGDRSVSFGVATGRPGLGNIPPKEMAGDSWLIGVPTLRSLTKSGLDIVEKGKLAGYYSDPVNADGDPTTVKKRTGKWWKLTIAQQISPHAVREITNFRNQIQAKGATLLISLPWIYGSTDKKTLANIQKTAQSLAQITPTIYEPDTYNIKTDSSLFADTHYHLLPESRKIRAKEIVEQLQPLLKER